MANQENDFHNILVVQNAFIGDAVLATAVLEKLHTRFPGAEISFLVRHDAAPLFEGHPFIKHLFVFNRKKGKFSELRRLRSAIRHMKFDLAVTLQRHFSSGYLVWRSGAGVKAGFSKNPFSFCFQYRATHSLDSGEHEIKRNQQVISFCTGDEPAMPALYPQSQHSREVVVPSGKFITISPASVWFTKQWPKEKWVELARLVPDEWTIFLLGGSADASLCEEMVKHLPGKKIHNMAGKLSFLGSAALMQKAVMNYTNDSAPLHICGAVGAPLTAVFCSTIPAFGFGPVSAQAKVAEVKINPGCRPCGYHGHKTCPQKHFKCALDIEVSSFAGELTP